MAGRQLPLFSLIVPAWMVWTMSGWRGLRGVWPAVLASGGSFAAVQFLISNTMGPALVDVAGGLASLVVMGVLLKLWRPKAAWRFEHEEEAPPSSVQAHRRYSRAETVSAWIPWLLLSACVFAWGLPQSRTFLDGGLTPEAIAQRTNASDAAPLKWWEKPNALAGWTAPRVAMPQLHNRIYRDVAVVGGQQKPEEAVLRFNWLSATGTAIFIAAWLSGAWLRLPPGEVARTFGETVVKMIWPLATIAAMLAIAFTTRYSGIDVTLGLAFTHTGVLYPFFAAILGWLGVALTGSDTSSNALFGSLQRFTAEQLGLNPILICAANSTGGVMGKMIDAQSIVVSAAATGQHGGEGKILRYVFWHSVALATLVGLVTLLQAYAFPWMAPLP
jgi:lactate permease